MIKRRLYLQIYFTIIASLLAIVVVIGLLFAVIRGGEIDFDDQVFGMTGRLAWMALPPATAPRSEQAEAIRKLGDEFAIDINLFDADRKLLGHHGARLDPPDEDDDDSGWHRGGMGPAWQIKLPDNRWLSVNLRRRHERRPLIGILLFLFGTALAIGLASYPFVRKLTGRLERLQTGVEQIGDGELSTRVTVEGKDEIAGLATSFNNAASKIERLVESNRQLLAHASHELRTPLARVRLGVEMLKEKPNAARQAALESDIGELDQLIDEILLMSRLDTNTKPQMNEIVDLLALAAEEASRYENCDVSGDIAEVQGNTKLLRRAVRNLVDNAFKHGSPPVEITIEEREDKVAVTVRDGGVGIAPEERDNIFQPFYRSPGKQNVPGYGLGLALVKQIAVAHDGDVEILPAQAGSNSGFEITLPKMA